MSSVDDIYAAAPRKSERFDLGAVDVTLLEMSVGQRVEWADFYNENEGNTERLFAKLISMCCVELSSQEPEQIQERLNPNTLIDMGNKIIEMSGLTTDKKKG